MNEIDFFTVALPWFVRGCVVGSLVTSIYIHVVIALKFRK